MKLAWTPTAARELTKLPKTIGERITEKMEWYASQDHVRILLVLTVRKRDHAYDDL